MLSYKSILVKPPPPPPEPNSDLIEEDIKEKQIVQKLKQIDSEKQTIDIKDINPIRQRIIHPRYKSPYTKKETIKWLYYKIDNGIFHYDYCSRMFELLRKWIKINKFSITTSEEVLFGRFISLMYLLSSKRNYIESH